MRIRRAVLVAVVVALAGTWSPPAEAVGASTVVVTGTLTLNGPVAAPCTTGPCPPTVTPSPPPFLGKMGPLYSTDGDFRTATFSQAACAPGACSLAFSTSYRGYCGLASGRGSGGLRDGNGAVHLLDLTFVLTGTEMAVRGNARSHATGELGDLFGTFTVVSPPAECAAGTATAFTMAGDLTVTYPKATP